MAKEVSIQIKNLATLRRRHSLRLVGESGLKTIIQKHIHAPCCGGTHSYLKSIDKYLEDVVDFADEFGTPPATTGFDNVIQSMKTNPWASEAVAQMLKDFKADPTTFNRNKVTNFDNTFASVASEAEDVTCAGCRFDVIADGVKYEFKSYSKSTVDNIAYGNLQNQHRGYIETGTISNTRYIFEKLKLNPPFIVQTPQGPVTLTGNDAADLYVRSKFLAMYKAEPAYFWNNGSTSGWWQSVSGINFADEDALLTWLNTQTYDSAWLNFIKVQ